MNTTEASMYEPRVGDLVTGRYVDVPLMVVGFPEDRIVACLDDAGTEHRRLRSLVVPLRPDAPGQRVRHEGSPVLVGRVARDLGDGFVTVAWEAGYGLSAHVAECLIRIADQAPAAQPRVVGFDAWMPAADSAAKTCAPPEAPPTEDARKESGYQTAPAAINQGPTCQHCGSGIVAGLLRDTCPRGCDLTLRAAEPEPDHVGTRLVPMRCGHEAVWIARGRGAIGTPHPTREGAIAAWREAVRAKGGSGGRP